MKCRIYVLALLAASCSNIFAMDAPPLALQESRPATQEMAPQNLLCNEWLAKTPKLSDGIYDINTIGIDSDGLLYIRYNNCLMVWQPMPESFMESDISTLANPSIYLGLLPRDVLRQVYLTMRPYKKFDPASYRCVAKVKVQTQIECNWDSAYLGEQEGVKLLINKFGLNLPTNDGMPTTRGSSKTWKIAIPHVPKGEEKTKKTFEDQLILARNHLKLADELRSFIQQANNARNSRKKVIKANAIYAWKAFITQRKSELKEAREAINAISNEAEAEQKQKNAKAEAQKELAALDDQYKIALKEKTDALNALEDQCGAEAVALIEAIADLKEQFEKNKEDRNGWWAAITHAFACKLRSFQPVGFF